MATSIIDAHAGGLGILFFFNCLRGLSCVDCMHCIEWRRQGGDWGGLKSVGVRRYLFKSLTGTNITDMWLLDYQ